MTLTESIRFKHTHFSDIMNRNYVEWEHNKIQLQSAFSTGCGQHCTYIFYHRCRKRPMSAIVNNFVNDKLCKDQLVYDFVRQKYRQSALHYKAFLSLPEIFCERIK